MKFMAPSLARAITGLFALIAIGYGAWILWGWGGVLLTVGFVVFIDTSSDEMVERFTNTRRGFPPQ